MIPAVVSKLNMYTGDPVYDRVMEEINAAQEEGLESFDLEVDKLDDEIRMDLLEALDVMGYQVTYDNDAGIFEVSID
jgi:hypothetical protein